MTDAVIKQGIARFQDVTVEDGLFTPAQALAIMARSHELGLTTRVHADAWKPSHGWETAVDGGAISAEHLTYTPDDEIDRVGRTDTIAVLLPVAELIYMTDRRANANRFVANDVPGRRLHRLLLVHTRHVASVDHDHGRLRGSA